MGATARKEMELNTEKEIKAAELLQQQGRQEPAA